MVTDLEKNETFAAALVLLYAETDWDLSNAFKNAMLGEYNPSVLSEAEMRDHNWGAEKVEQVMMLWRTVYL